MSDSEPFSAGCGRRDERLLLFAAADRESLREQIQLFRTCGGSPPAPHANGPARAAIVANRSPVAPPTLERALAHLRRPAAAVRGGRGVYVGFGEHAGRIAFAFPGQAAPLPPGRSTVAAELVQETIVDCSLDALRAARELGLRASLAVGHSLGELLALHWSGAVGRQALRHIARVRGRAMSAAARTPGAMLALDGAPAACAESIAAAPVTVACLNGPGQRVVAGTAEAIESVSRRARELDVRATRLQTVGAFHCDLMAPAVRPLERALALLSLGRLKGQVISTVTGGPLAAESDLRALLARQLCSPVRFEQAARLVMQSSDLIVEVGPGATLAGLFSRLGETPVVSMRWERPSRARMLELTAAAYAAGAIPAPRHTVLAA